jgi:hypothetical protein
MNDLTTNLNTLTDRITDSLKPKFKVGQQVVCVMSKENVTKDNVYVVEESYVCASNIPCVAVIGDNGKMFRYYQTYFKAADMSKFDVKMSVEDATFVVEGKIDECYKEENVVGGKGDLFVNYFVGSEFITKIQHDKELQKALLVLIGGDK